MIETELPETIRVEDVVPEEVLSSSLLIQCSGVSFICRYLASPGSKTLCVVLVGSHDLAVPHFARLRWLEFLDGHILAVADPSLFTGGDWRALDGSDAVPALAHLSRTFAAKLGLLYSQVIIYGAHAGALIALVAAAEASTCALVINPVTATEGGTDGSRLARSAAQAIAVAKRDGRPPRFVLVQTESESAQFQDHFVSFCRTHKIPETGGMGFGGCAKAIVASSEGADNAGSLISRISSEGISFLQGFDYDDPGQIVPGEVDGQAFSVRSHGISFPCRFKSVPGSDLLYVGLHAAVNRGKETLPLYARWNWGQILRGSVLSIDDPTLYLDNRLRLSWYIGTKEKEVTKGLVRIAKAFAARLGVETHRIIFYGTSGGGFASIVAAAECSASCVAINPQTDVARYGADAVTEFAAVFDPTATATESRAAFPTRWSATDAMLAARAAGQSPQVAIIQNMTNDQYTVNLHYLPFCQTLGVPADGGIGFGGSVISMTYSDEAGHDASDTPEVLRMIQDQVLPFFENCAATRAAAVSEALAAKAHAEKTSLAALPRYDVAGLDPGALDGRTFVVHSDGVAFPCRYTSHPEKLLFVMLHAAIDREKESLPVFARWNWGNILRGHVLAVCDPTLYLHHELRLGWYAGDRETDPVLGLARIAESFAAKLGIASSQVIFYGSSGGGFAALMAAAKASAGCVAINPQTDIARYYSVSLSRFMKAFDPGRSPEECRSAFPARWSAVEALWAARRAGRTPRVVIAQNDLDHVTHDEHYLPFCRALEVPPEGGIGFRRSIKSITFSDEAGHNAADSPAVLRRILEEGVPFLTTHF